MPPRQPLRPEKTVKACPYCANEIQDAAIKCQWCNERLDAPIVENLQAPLVTQPPEPAPPAKRQKRKGGGILLTLYILVGCAAFAWASYLLLNHEHRIAAGVAILAGIAFIFLAPIAWTLGDLLRRFANPTAYWVQGGALDMAAERLYWMVGPQSIAVFFTFCALGAGVYVCSVLPALQDKPSAAEASAPQADSDSPKSPAPGSDSVTAPVAPPEPAQPVLQTPPDKTDAPASSALPPL